MSDNSTLPATADKKSITSSFVRQIKEMEIEKLKLSQLNKRLKQEQKDLLEEAEWVTAEAQVNLKNAQRYYKETLSIKNGKPKLESFPFLAFFVLLIVGGIGGLIVGGILSGLFGNLLESWFGHIPVEVFSIVYLLIFFAIGAFLGILFVISTWHSDNKKNRSEFASRIAGLQQDEVNVKKAEIQLQKSVIDSETAKKQAQTIDMQIKINEQNITKIGLLIQKMHELDIIPPDYRTVDCIITLDHIFKNDLADTVRDAVLLYKDWVYHELIITGIDNIYKMMGKLSESMQYMQRTLDSIDQNVSALSDDMSRLVGLQKESNRTQEQILQESQATRSATESIQRSNEKYEWYVEQHRQGLL